MRVPRRTPYERAEALGHLYSLLYPGEQSVNIDDDGYRQQRNEGLAIVHLWLNRSCCPYAVESTGTLIHAQQLDEQLLLLGLSSSTHTGSEWVVRSAYAMAVLRFVNSVADTYQTSMYAQSIFQISQRIGLPIWLVELRHSATHEEMPSLFVLRDACKNSLQWLQQHFWHPTLARRSLAGVESRAMGESPLQAAQMQMGQQEAASKLRKHLAGYRRLAKGVARDESLRGRSRTALIMAQNQVESCAKKVEAALGQGREVPEQEEGWEGEQEVAAAALLVDVLLEPGGIIPLSKKKRSNGRQYGKDAVAPIPLQLYQTWFPLLNHLSSSTDSFAEVLQEGLVAIVTQNAIVKHGRSYLDTAASWLLALFGDDKPALAPPKTLSRLQLYSERSEEEEGIEEDKPTVLLARRCLTSPTATSLAVARQLCAKDDVLMERIKPLMDMVLSSVENGKGQGQSGEGIEEKEAIDLEQSVLEMEKRLEEWQERRAEGGLSPHARPAPIITASKQDECQSNVCKQLVGWQVAPEEWKPTPIGCLNGSVPDLVFS